MAMNQLRIIITVLLFFSFAPASGNEVRIDVSAPSEVNIGEQFRVVYTVNADVERFIAPDFGNLNVITGPSQSTSSSIQIINQQVTRTQVTTFTFIVAATSEGTHLIPPARVRSGNKEYNSDPVVIKAVAGTQAQPGRPAQPQAPAGMPGERDVFLRAVADKTSAWVGEEIIVIYKLFTRVPVARYSIDQTPSHSGFWSEELTHQQGRITQYTEIYNDQRYTVAELRKVALFPHHAGTLTVEPLEIQVVVQVPQQTRRLTGDPFFDSFFNDPFFGSHMQNVTKNLRSNALPIKVKPLPAHNQPANFGGAVGNFTLQATVDKTETKANEAINLNVVISGNGNLRLVEKLDISFPPAFEVFEPEASSSIRATPAGVSGTRTINYLMIPRSAGNYTIRPATFSFFNPDLERYVTLQTPEFNFLVHRSETTEISDATDVNGQQAIQMIGTDIRFIRQLPFRLQLSNVWFVGSLRFYLWLLGPVMFFIIFLFFWRKHIRLNNDIAHVRNRRATRIARSRLNKANQYLKLRLKDPYFEELAKALWGYLSDKFNIPPAELSLETVQEKLKLTQVNQQIISSYVELLNHCEYARFAPQTKNQSMEIHYETAMELIEQIEKEL